MPSFYQDRLGTNIGKEHSKKSGVSAGRRLCAHAGCVFSVLVFFIPGTLSCFVVLVFLFQELCLRAEHFSRGLWLSLSRACLDKSHVVARAVSFPVFSRFLLTYVFIAGTFLHQGQRARAPARRTRSRPCWKITAAAGRSPPHRRRPTPSRRYLHSIIIINVLIYINSINNNAIKK
jgi:hypothetical protein